MSASDAPSPPSTGNESSVGTLLTGASTSCQGESTEDAVTSRATAPAIEEMVPKAAPLEGLC